MHKGQFQGLVLGMMCLLLGTWGIESLAQSIRRSDGVDSLIRCRRGESWILVEVAGEGMDSLSWGDFGQGSHQVQVTRTFLDPAEPVPGNWRWRSVVSRLRLETRCDGTAICIGKWYRPTGRVQEYECAWESAL
jgi:hypothetical protein